MRVRGLYTIQRKQQVRAVENDRGSLNLVSDVRENRRLGLVVGAGFGELPEAASWRAATRKRSVRTGKEQEMRAAKLPIPGAHLLPSAESFLYRAFGRDGR